MSSERIIFKFKPSIDIENEYASSEQFISAYFEGIRMLLGENRLSFDVNNPEDALSVSYNGEYWQVTSLYSSGDAWGNTVELTINKMDEEQKLSVSTDMIGDEDAWKLLKVVFEKNTTPPVDMEKPVRFLAKIKIENGELYLLGCGIFQQFKGRTLGES